MSILTKIAVLIKFKLGIYELRQIIKIEKSGIVISVADSRYRTDAGVRYELSPDEWFIYSWRFFPRYAGQIFCDEETFKSELYYDYFAKVSPYHMRPDYYAVFKNGHNTGYIISKHYRENRSWHNPLPYSFMSMHINGSSTSDYTRVFDNNFAKPIQYAENLIEAAICILSDLDGFKQTKIEMSSLLDDCKSSPESCALHAKLTELLPKCLYTNFYLKN